MAIPWLVKYHWVTAWGFQLRIWLQPLGIPGMMASNWRIIFFGMQRCPETRLCVLCQPWSSSPAMPRRISANNPMSMSPGSFSHEKGGSSPLTGDMFATLFTSSPSSVVASQVLTKGVMARHTGEMVPSQWTGALATTVTW